MNLISSSRRALTSRVPAAHGLLDLPVELRYDPVVVRVDAGAQQCVSLLQQTRHVFIGTLVHTRVCRVSPATRVLLLLQPDHRQSINTALFTQM